MNGWTSRFVATSLLVFGAGLASGLFFVLFSPFVAGDSSDYLRIASNLASGNGYALVAGTPTVVRPPLYPVFIAGIFTLFGHDAGPVLAAQAGLVGLTGWLVYLAGRGLFSERAAIGGGLLAAVYPHFSFYAGTVLSETLATALLAGLTLATIRLASDRSTLKLALLSGVLAAWLVLTATHFIAAPAAMILAVLARQPWRRTVVIGSVVLVGFAAGLAPWIARNARTFGEPIVLTVGQQGPPLYAAAAGLGLYDYRGFGLLSVSDPLLQRRARLYVDEAGERDRLAERQQVERELISGALATITSDPLRYLAHQAGVVPYLWIQPAAYAGHFRPPFEQQNDNVDRMIPQGHLGAAALRVTSIVVFTLGLFGGALAGLWSVRRRWRDILPLVLPALYLTAVHAPLFIEHRYTVPAQVLLWPLASSGLASARRALTRTFGRR